MATSLLRTKPYIPFTRPELVPRARLIQRLNAGLHRDLFVLDYLLEEVLQQQSESAQTFLLHTSIFDRLAGSLCDAVRFGMAKPPSSCEATAVRFGYIDAPTEQDSGPPFFVAPLACPMMLQAYS